MNNTIPSLIELVQLQKQLEIAKEEKGYFNQRLNYVKFAGSSIPELYKAAKSYLHITKSPMIFVRCYTAPGEVTSSEIKQCIRVVKMGCTTHFIFPEEIKAQPELNHHEIPDLLREKRAVKIKAIYEALITMVKTYVWVNHKELNTLIISQSTRYGHDAIETIKSWIWSLLHPDQAPVTRYLPRNF